MRQALAYEAIQDGSQPGVIVPQQTELTEGLIVFFTSNRGNAFTPGGLDAIAAAERVLTSVPGYSSFCLRNEGESTCAPVVSPLSMFYEDPEYTDPVCPGLGPGDAMTQACIDSVLADDSTFENNRVYFSRGYDPATRTNPITRSIVQFGGPLYGFENRADRAEVQEDAFEKLMEVYLDVFDGIDNNPAVVSHFRVAHVGGTIIDLEVSSYITGDLLLAFGSVVVVFIVLTIQLWSPIMACAGLAAIGCSFFGAYFLYRMVFQVVVFPIVNALPMILLLGIGADDVLVVVDAYKQVSQLPARLTSNPGVRMSLTFSRAASATFATSFTTLAAFVATSFSPIPAISTFGIFAACLVGTVYFLTITFLPAVTYLWSKWCSSRCCFRKTDRFLATHERLERARQQVPTSEEQQEDVVSDDGSDEVSDSDSDDDDDDEGGKGHDVGFDVSELRFAERFFHSYYAPGLFKIRYLVVVLFVIASGFFIWGFLQLENPQTPENGLPDGSSAKKAIELLEEAFDPDPSSEINTMRLVFGVTGLKRVDSSGKTLDRNRAGIKGQLLLDPNFDLSPPANQEYLVEVCDAILARTCFSCGTAPGYNNLVLPSGVDDSRCFMSEFKTWREGRGEAFPVPQAELNARLKEFVDSEDGIDVRSNRDVGFDASGRPVYAVLNFVTPINVIEANKKMRSWFDIWFRVTEALPLRPNEGPSRPPGLTFIYPTLGAGSSPESFAWMVTFELMTQSVYTTIVISLSLAFAMLLLVTLNLWISFLAFVVLGTIVTAIVTVMVLLDWNLGVNEALGLVMLVGLAVDYTVHLGHSFAESEASGHLPAILPGTSNPNNVLRGLKAQHALTEMGVSILGGALTTIGAASVILIFAKLPFFKVFSSSIFITILISLVVSMTYFVAGLQAVGPLGDQGRVKVWARKVYQKCGGDNERVLARLQ